MKIRNGFVSNSSSSSFLISLSKIPENNIEVHKLFFQDLDYDKDIIGDDRSFPIKRLSTIIYEDIIYFNNLDEAEKLKMIKAEIVDNMIKEKWNYKKQEFEYIVDKQYFIVDDHIQQLINDIEDKVDYDEKAFFELSEIYYKNYLENNKNSKLVALSYSDNDDFINSYLEHGNHWYNVIHIKNNHH